MASPTRKTRPGLSFGFPAGMFNDLVELIRWWKRQRTLSQAGQKGIEKSETVSMLKNTTPDDLPKGSVVQLDGRILDNQDFENLLGLSGILVEDEDDLKPVAIFLFPCPAGKQAPAAIAGAAIARIDVTDVNHKFADPTESEAFLTSKETGGFFELLEEPEATGEQKLLVRFARSTVSETGLFSVSMEQTGGSDGSATYPATWTYEVRDLNSGDLLGEDVDPTTAPHKFGGRPNVGITKKALVGIAEFLDEADVEEDQDNFRIIYCDEVPTREVC